MSGCSKQTSFYTETHRQDANKLFPRQHSCKHSLTHVEVLQPTETKNKDIKSLSHGGGTKYTKSAMCGKLNKTETTKRPDII